MILKYWKQIAIIGIIIGAFIFGVKYESGAEAKRQIALVAKYKIKIASQDAALRKAELELIKETNNIKEKTNYVIKKVKTYITTDCSISDDGLFDINGVLTRSPTERNTTK